MPNLDINKIRDDLKLEEGTVLHAYQDSLGYWTIGSGILIDKRKGGGITSYENDTLLDNRIHRAISDVDLNIPWVINKSDGIQRALVNMTYQMGIEGLLKFKDMLQYIKDDKFDKAADEALDSEWAKETPPRAHRVSELIRKG